MKKILIIGATSSIAQHCAKIWAARHDKLHLVARNKKQVQITASDLKVRGAMQVSTYCVDLNNINHHSKLIEAADKALNGIDIVLIAHGTLPRQKSCEENVRETLAEIHTNAISSISLLTLIANYFEKKQNGTIAVISSVAGDRGRASNYVYGSTKAMVTTFMSGLRQRLHKFNVSVVTIKPGLIDTPMTVSFKKGLLWVKPAQIARKIVKSIDVNKDEVYVPAFWRVVMSVIKAIPNRAFAKIKL